jgi:hypothetical protein
MPGAAVTATRGATIIVITGDNPATVTMASTYANLGGSGKCSMPRLGGR